MDEPTGWATEDHYRLLSVPVLVRTMHPGFADALRWHLAPFWRKGPGASLGAVVDMWERQDADQAFPVRGPDAPRFVYYRDGQTRIASLTSLLSFALWDVHSMVPLTAQDFLFVHAGAVARGEAGALLVGAMDAGKSTLTTALLMAGFEYLSDELGAIDPITTRIYPFEKRISLDPQALDLLPGLEERLADRQGLSAGLRARYARPEDLGASVAGPRPVRTLVLVSADREGPPRLFPVRRAEAVHRLVPYCFNLDRHRERGIVLLSRLVAGACVYRLVGGASIDRAALLAEHLP